MPKKQQHNKGRSHFRTDEDWYLAAGKSVYKQAMRESAHLRRKGRQHMHGRSARRTFYGS